MHDLDLADGDWSRLASRLEFEMHRLGHTQASLEAALGPHGPRIRSIRNAMRQRGTRTYSEIPPTHKRLAAFFGWAPGSIETVLAGGDPVYLPTAPVLPAPKTKAEKWEEAQRLSADPELNEAQLRAALRVLQDWPETN